MGKPKRKSEGDLPPAKKQFRKTAQYEVDIDASYGEDESSDEILTTAATSTISRPTKAERVRKAAAKTRRSEPVQRIEHSEEPEEEGVQMESQQFVKFVAKKEKEKTQAARATADFMARFKSAVEEDEEALKEHVETLTKDAANRDAEFLEAFRDAFLTSRPKAPPAKDSTRGKSTPSTMVFASLYERSQQLTHNANAIASTFAAANETCAGIELSDLINVDALDNAANQVQGLIDCGHRVGLEKYQRMLAGDGPGPGPVQAAEAESAEMFYPAAQHSPSAAWGIIAKKAEKHARKLLKALPPRLGR